MVDAPAEPAAGKPSKSQRKRDSHELQALGVALLALPDARLDALGLPEPLVAALREARPLKSHEARRRQLQLVGKLMRSADVEAARRAVDDRERGRLGDALALHRAERWRAELVADDAALTRFVAAHARSDVQRLRSLVREARKDAALPPESRHGRAWRELFRLLRDTAVASAGGPAPHRVPADDDLPTGASRGPAHAGDGDAPVASHEP